MNIHGFLAFGMMVVLSAVSAAESGICPYPGLCRGIREEKNVALVFTGDEFSEGCATIRDTLRERKVKAAFYFTGRFLDDKENLAMAVELYKDGHLVGPHSNRHLYYCRPDKKRTTLVSRSLFQRDLRANIRKLEKAGIPDEFRYWLAPFEHYNEDIYRWSREMHYELYSPTPGLKTWSDWMPDTHKDFMSAEALFRQLVEYEEKDGLNGHIILVHVGAEERSDRLFDQLDRIIGHLGKRGYAFSRVDELLDRVKELDNVAE